MYITYYTYTTRQLDNSTMAPVYRIKIFSSFCNSHHAKSIVEELVTENIDIYGSAPEKRVFVVDADADDYTHVIIWNTAMPDIPPHIPKKNVIGLAYEPRAYLQLNAAFLAYASKYIHTYYLGDAHGLPAPFVQGNAFLIYSPPRPRHIPFKHSCMSIIVSHKKHLHGHIYRHALAQTILTSNLPIDIYGTGCTGKGKYSHFRGARVKGKFTKYEPYDGYLFTICIENTRSEDYFSEKIINPLLCNTTPVYLGCRNIHKYFPGNAIELSGDISEDVAMLVRILQDPVFFSKRIDRTAIEKKVSLVHNVDALFPIHP